MSCAPRDRWVEVEVAKPEVEGAQAARKEVRLQYTSYFPSKRWLIAKVDDRKQPVALEIASLVLPFFLGSLP